MLASLIKVLNCLPTRSLARAKPSSVVSTSRSRRMSKIRMISRIIALLFVHLCSRKGSAGKREAISCIDPGAYAEGVRGGSDEPPLGAR